MADGIKKLSIKKATTTDRVRHQLEQDILCGLYSPGEHLDETALSVRLGCSRTPVREALSQLVALGLLVRRNHCGVYVAGHDRKRLAAMVEAYVEVEALCTSLAIARMTVADRKAFADKIKHPDALLDEIRTGCGNPVIGDLVEGLKARIDPFLRNVGAEPNSSDAQDAAALAAAVAEGDGGRASDIIRGRMNTMVEKVGVR